MTFAKPKLPFAAVSALLALFYTLPFLTKYDYWGVRDWDLFSTIAAVPVGTIVYYGQFPFWNPYLAGGNVLFHHPEVAVLSPFLLLYMVFGAVIGLKIQVLICYFLGFWGSQRLFEQLGLSWLASIVASVAYFGSVHFSLHFAEGHMPFTHYCFLPWFLFFVLRADRRMMFNLAAGVSLALMVLGNGAAVPLLYTLTFSTILIGLRSLSRRDLTELKNLAAATVSGLGLAAVKFIPMIAYLMENRWQGRADESIPLAALRPIFFGLDHSLFARNFTGQYWNWHEYGAYVSPLLAVLAVVGLATAFRRHWGWALTAVFFLLLGLGDFGTFSPWALLSHLPGFYSARATGRAFQFVILPVSILGGLGLDRVVSMSDRSKPRRMLSYAAYIAAALIVVTNAALAWPIMNSAFKEPPAKVKRSREFRHVIEGESRMFANYLANRGSLVAPELSATYPSRALIGPDDSVLMEYAVNGGAHVVQRQYTPNKIVYQIIGREPGEMMISMGYDRGWRAADARSVVGRQGLITFGFSTGPQRIVLTYRPPYLYPGIFVSILTLIAVLFLGRRDSKLSAKGGLPDSR